MCIESQQQNVLQHIRAAFQINLTVSKSRYSLGNAPRRPIHDRLDLLGDNRVRKLYDRCTELRGVASPVELLPEKQLFGHYISVPFNYLVHRGDKFVKLSLNKGCELRIRLK